MASPFTTPTSSMAQIVRVRGDGAGGALDRGSERKPLTPKQVSRTARLRSLCATNPMQVIVIPFRLREAHDPEYAIFRRSDDAKWQPIAGGAEDAETPVEAARREASEEAGLPFSTPLYELQSLDSVPVFFPRPRNLARRSVLVPQICFAADATDLELEISDERTKIEWLDYDSATARPAYQSNATALWELNERLKRRDLPCLVQ